MTTSNTEFSSLALDPELLENLTSLGYHNMTPIQADTLPLMLRGKDVIGQGKTGSGKTAAFGLGLLANLDVKRFRIQALVLCPTRELADQVAKEIRKLARRIHNIKVLTLCGGMPFGPQIGSLEHGAHILVGTPGRILDHLDKGRIDLSELNTLVLDEADRMLDMGFQEALDAIIEQTPHQRQTLLFSATFPKAIKTIAERIMHEPQLVKVESQHASATIAQYFYRTDSFDDRLTATQILLLTHRPESSVIFCNTKHETQEVADLLDSKGFDVTALHGDLEQRDRDQALVRFANKSVSILVATDVAARGLDIESLDAVFNFQLAHDPEVHVHRIGRTGRAGSQGMAFNFFAEKEAIRVAQIDEYMDIAISPSQLPSNNITSQPPFKAKMTTILIDGGKKQKVRAGDILGALTGGDSGINAQQVGKIHLFDMRAYVAVEQSIAKVALKKIANGKMKGKNFRARILHR